MADDHECGERPCNPGRYGGAYLRCTKCSKKYYGECLEKRKEVVQLLSALKGYNQHGTPSGLQTKIKAILHPESLIEFICVKCKPQGNSYEVINNLKSEMMMITNKRDEEYNKLKKKHSELEKINNELIEKIVILESGQHIIEMDVDKIDQSSHEGQNEIKKEMKSQNRKLLEQINDSIVIMPSDIEARIKLEFEKIQQQMQKVNEPEPERKRKKITDNIETNNEQQNLIINKGKKLKPPKKEDNDNREIYEIHISRFDMKTTEKDIETYIMEKTKIKYRDTFKVTKLVGKLDDNIKKYTSFKVTTLLNEVYKQIINTKIWEPEFIARDYEHNYTKHYKYERNDGRSTTTNTNINRKTAFEETPKRYGGNRSNIHRETLINNYQRENRNERNERIETNIRNMNSPGRNTPRSTTNYRGGKFRNFGGYYPNMEMVPRFTQWIPPQPLMFGPPNPNFLMPLNHQNQNIEQRPQQTTQNTNQNQN